MDGLRGVGRLSGGWTSGILPRGRALGEETWGARHRFMLVLLWFHVLGVPVFGIVRGVGLGHALVEVLPILMPAVCATWPSRSRVFRTTFAAIGLISASAVLTHLSGGSTEMHFHFFVMIGALTLYRDWVPFIVAIGYVVLHHGLLGSIAPADVYNHAAAISAPWKWALIHAGFVLAASAVHIAGWKVSEASEAARKEAMTRFERAFTNAPIGMAIADPGGAYLMVNSQFCALLGCSAEEVLGSNWQSHTHPQDLGEQEELGEQLLSGKIPAIQFEKRYVRADGTIVPALVSASVVWSTNGSPLYFVSHIQDITERKRLDEMKSSFLNAVSHELRTPLTSVLGYAQTLERVLRNDLTLPDDPPADMAERITANAQRLKRLLDDLLDVDRLTRGVVEAQLRPVQLDQLILGLLAELSLTSGDRVRLELDVKTAHVDAAMVERIIENLVVNALKHTSPDSLTTIRAYMDPEGLMIEVEDTGNGVPLESRGDIFEPFFRGPHVPLHAPGTGIGLSLVAKFAELHGGSAWVVDGLDGGACFKVLLPQRRDADLAAPPATPAAHPATWRDGRGVQSMRHASASAGGDILKFAGSSKPPTT